MALNTVESDRSIFTWSDEREARLKIKERLKRPLARIAVGQLSLFEPQETF